MIYAQVTLVFVQFLAVLGCLFAMLRILNRADAIERAQASMENGIQAAQSMADIAQRAVEALTVEHYKALQTQFLALETKVNSANAGLLSMEESIASVNNKLASRERQDKAREKKEARIEEPDAPVTPGLPPELEAALRNGGAFMMPTANEPAVPSMNGRKSTFGQHPKPL